jgi:hypothetical protein
MVKIHHPRKTRKRHSFKKGGGLSPLSPGKKTSPKASPKASRKLKKKEDPLSVTVLIRETRKLYKDQKIKPVKNGISLKTLSRKK